jgi:hypothetical protein
MEEDPALVTREQYVEMLIDASCWDASEMESGFLFWCERHVTIWREQGCDETWIRLRIAMAQRTRELHRTLKHQGLTMLEIREELRKMYRDAPQLYDLARARARLSPGLLQYRGNTGDLRQRYTLRVLLYETDKLAYERFCRWRGRPMPGPESVFFEQPDAVRVVRDLSTVEELELALAMSSYTLHLFAAVGDLTTDQIVPLVEAHGRQLRAAFIARYGYQPEDSATPYVPVTIDGPQDHDAYYAKEYP